MRNGIGQPVRIDRSLPPAPAQLLTVGTERGLCRFGPALRARQSAGDRSALKPSARDARRRRAGAREAMRSSNSLEIR
jgi:hypothetical protein